MELIQSLKDLIRSKEDKCHVVVDKDTREICGNKSYGKGYSNGYEFRFCKKHVPSEATPWNSGRVEPLIFKVQEGDAGVLVKVN